MSIVLAIAVKEAGDGRDMGWLRLEPVIARDDDEFAGIRLASRVDEKQSIVAAKTTGRDSSG